jgi:hypothetical protein
VCFRCGWLEIAEFKGIPLLYLILIKGKIN